MANGNFGGGNGTVETPFLVEDAQDLQKLKDYLVTPEVHFKQVADINFTNSLFAPIGDYTDGPFLGTYNGGHYIVNGLKIAVTEGPSGLFGFTQGGSAIKNVTIENVEIKGVNMTGGLIGQSGSAVSGCSVNGIITGNDYTGGLIGMASNAGKIVQCSSKGVVKGYKRVGGLAGQVATIEEVTDSYSTCDVEATGDSSIGGLIGNPVNDTPVKNCYANGTITSSITNLNEIGGLLGTKYSPPNVIASYYDSDKAGVLDTGKGDPKTTTELQNTETFSGWDFENVWKMVHGQLLLQFEPDPEPPTPIIPSLQAQFFAKIGGQWFRLDSNN